MLTNIHAEISRSAGGGNKKPSAQARSVLTAEKKRLAKTCDFAKKSLDNAFLFLDSAFSEDSQESLIFVTKLSADSIVIKFVADFGSNQFMKHNKSLLFTERGLDLLSEIEELED